MTPTEELRAAARHIRYLAGDPADWDMDSSDWKQFTVYEDHGVRRTTVAVSPHPTRSVHIATWDPAAAHAVADLLDQHAGEHDSYDCGETDYDGFHCAALKTARLILKGATQ